MLNNNKKRWLSPKVRPVLHVLDEAQMLTGRSCTTTHVWYHTGTSS